MKKIRLDVDSLEVLTFAPDERTEAARGTVHGHATPVNTCYVNTCNDSCDVRCRSVTETICFA